MTDETSTPTKTLNFNAAREVSDLKKILTEQEYALKKLRTGEGLMRGQINDLQRDHKYVNEGAVKQIVLATQKILMDLKRLAENQHLKQMKLENARCILANQPKKMNRVSNNIIKAFTFSDEFWSRVDKLTSGEINEMFNIDDKDVLNLELEVMEQG